jgi:NAD(P)-dependent dehydrogenase (short-subunit alcohol dehydrogenase family)
MFFLASLDPCPSLDEIDLVEFRKECRDRVLLLHGAVRGLYKSLALTGSFLVAATRMGGHHGYVPSGAQNPLGGAIVGFVKATRRERPNALVKAVDFSESVSSEGVVRALLDEAARDPDAVETGYQGNLRVSVGAESFTAMPTAKARVALDANTVFVVTGAVGTITAAIVRDLAAASRGTFYLLDARQMPADSDRPLVEKAMKDREGAKREIFKLLVTQGGRGTPAQIEERLFNLERQASILETLNSIEAAGGRAFYRQIDVLDGNGVRIVIDDIRRQNGRIDVLLHAAGVERRNSLDRKLVEEFDLAFRVKADGLFNLMVATSGLHVAALVVCSSLAARFGEAGRADSCAGNDFMCKAVGWWAGARPNSIGIAVDWPVWNGTVMSTSGSPSEIERERGIKMLDLAEGLSVIRHTLLAGYSGEVVVGRRLDILAQSVDADGTCVQGETRNGCL